LPVSDAELAMKTPQVDKDAGVEALFWRVHVLDQAINGTELQRALSQNLWARSEENRFGGSPNRKYSEREFCEERVRFALLSINRVGFGHCQGKPCGLASLGLDSDRTPP